MTLQLSLIRWCATLVGVQMLCGIVWVLGPLLPALDPWPARLAIMMALLLAWAAANLVLDWRRARRDMALAAGVAGAAEEAAALDAKLAAAMQLMRKGRRSYLYEQPWYVIIGPPGAGKTTALLNAGLDFPLAGALGPGAIAGVGGTRHCEWWFTQDAVLIDTAGRYTTQDSNREVDRAGWDKFLSLLRRTRPRQPLNGVIVAIALNDVVASTPELVEAHAVAIRSRVDELETRLGMRMPAYVLFTKADLLVGFCEFFEDLDAAGRQQVWGATFPLRGTPDCGAGLHPLLERLDRRVFARLDAETDPERRTLIAGFPSQFASTLAPLHAFVTRTFGPDAAGAAPLLRGVYLTSGTQEGTPIDRLIGALSRSFGLSQRRAVALRPQAGRSYFLHALLHDVVFREAMLVSDPPGAARRRRMVRAAGFAACAVIALLGAGLILGNRARSLEAVARAQAAVTERQHLAASVPLDPVADADVAQLVPWLDALRAGADVQPAPPDRLGFSQDAKLAAAAGMQYRHALGYALFPRLVWRAETQIRGALTQPDALYEATRVYLMLGGAGPMDRTLLADWFARDWAATLPGDDQAKLRAALGQHLAALLEEPLPAIALDGPLVASARAIIARVPLPVRAYSRLKPLALAKGVSDWQPSAALGPAGVQVFLRLSGRGLEQGVPGLYTQAGFHDAVLPALPHAADAAAAEGWVLGTPIAPDSPQRRTLQADILALYAAEYAAAWNAILADLDPAPLRSLTQAAQDLYILASPHSPMRALLASAAQELAPAASAPPMDREAMMQEVDQQFAPLRGVLGTGGAAPIDLALRPLSDLQQQLAKQAASAARPAATAIGEDPAAALRAEALRQPQPLSRWLTALATGGAALRDGGPRGAMIAAWNAGGGPAALCSLLIGNRYPFAPSAEADISLADFTRLFGPGGAIDAFFNTQLKPYVDASSRPWKLQAVDGVSAPLTAADLAQFQRAAGIRDLFFPAGAQQPLVRFDVTPEALEPGIASASLDLGGVLVGAAHGMPPRPAALTWPGHTDSAHLTVNATGAPIKLDAAGPWAAFRLLARAHATPHGDRQDLAFSAGEHTVRFGLRASPNPFASTLLTEFRCPAVQ